MMSQIRKTEKSGVFLEMKQEKMTLNMSHKFVETDIKNKYDRQCVSMQTHVIIYVNKTSLVSDSYTVAKLQAAQ